MPTRAWPTPRPRWTARAILMERWAEDAELVGKLREWLGEVGVIRAKWWKARKAGEIPRLLRPRRAAGEDSLAPPLALVPRPPRNPQPARTGQRRGRRQRHRRRPHRATCRHCRQGPSADAWLLDAAPGPGASSCSCT
jgi:hypothetical protein